MASIIVFLLVAFIFVFVIAYRFNSGDNFYKFIANQSSILYNKYAPYSFKEIRQKVKDLGQEYTKKQYMVQIAVFSISAAVISYLYFYNVLISLLYIIASIIVIPVLTY